MSEPFVGEIRPFGFNFAPRGWAQCNGQLLPIAQNDALFSLLGTTYGGDGRTTFGLPGLRGRLPIHFDAAHRQGNRTGVETVTLQGQQIPAHTHGLRGSSAPASSTSPENRLYAEAEVDLYGPAGQEQATLQATGGAQPHSNLMPFTCVNFCIALFGTYPSRF